MSVRTLEALSDALAGSLIWRKREMTALRFLAENAKKNSSERSALLRALAILFTRTGKVR